MSTKTNAQAKTVTAKAAKAKAKAAKAKAQKVTAKAKAKKVKEPSKYKERVLVPNRERVNFEGSIGACRARILAAYESGASYPIENINVLKLSKVCKANYQHLAKNIKGHPKSGRYNCFTLNQWINKRHVELTALFNKNASEARAKATKAKAAKKAA